MYNLNLFLYSVRPSSKSGFTDAWGDLKLLFWIKLGLPKKDLTAEPRIVLNMFKYEILSTFLKTLISYSACSVTVTVLSLSSCFLLVLEVIYLWGLWL